MPSTDLQIDWLRSFVAAVDAGSLTAAGRLVHRSQSAVSMQLAKLEQATGQRLLLRTPRQVQLTPAGRELLDHARGIVSMHQQAVQTMRGEALHGRLVVGAPEDFAVPYLAPVLRDFAHRHAAVELVLVCRQSKDLIPCVERGEVDVALVSRDRPGRGQPLFEEPLVWAAPPASDAWRASPLPVAVYDEGSSARRAALSALRAARKPYRIVYESGSPAGLVAAVEAGLAVALFTRCSVPAGYQVLGGRHGLPALAVLQVMLLRSRASARKAAADAMEQQVVKTWRKRPGA